MPLYINVNLLRVCHSCFALDEGSFLADDLAMIAERFPALKNLSSEEKLMRKTPHPCLSIIPSFFECP
jgi:hypothetical protein